MPVIVFSFVLLIDMMSDNPYLVSGKLLLLDNLNYSRWLSDWHIFIKMPSSMHFGYPYCEFKPTKNDPKDFSGDIILLLV